mmetsp:Transcript_11555/g.31148  ORF Transcript_11555/g.31148 Transcript_11555/m.31148 type:complete len:89 (-) Transcript_11555:749-1015(-)
MAQSALRLLLAAMRVAGEVDLSAAKLTLAAAEVTESAAGVPDAAGAAGPAAGMPKRLRQVCMLWTHSARLLAARRPLGVSRTHSTDTT